MICRTFLVCIAAVFLALSTTVSSFSSNTNPSRGTQRQLLKGSAPSRTTSTSHSALYAVKKAAKLGVGVTARFRMSKTVHLATAVCVLKFKNRFKIQPLLKYNEVPIIVTYRAMLRQAWADRKVKEKLPDKDAIENWVESLPCRPCAISLTGPQSTMCGPNL